MGVTIDLSGRRALVTGGNRGIGRTIAERLADAGADVAVFARSEESVSEAARALSERGVRGLPWLATWDPTPTSSGPGTS